MGRARHLWGVALAALGSLVLAPVASAQDTPDVRDVRPIVMLLVDTSGSMEKKADCACTTDACTECLPLSECSGSFSGSDDPKTRWATVLEALTGQWNDYYCTQRGTSSGRYSSFFSGEFDYGYHLPHFEPPPSTEQAADGILDAYVERAKFGLMTFDGEPTFHDTGDLVFQSIFEARLGDNVSAAGEYSYGEPKPFTFPGCGEPHMIDNGARNESAEVGQLVSVGSDTVSDYRTVNQKIQQVLLGTRPAFGTPIAGMLSDVRYYFDNDPDVAPVSTPGSLGDPWAECRDRYVILLTDGLPSGEMRRYGCGAAGFECPYESAETIAADLCQWSGADSSCTGRVKGVFVVGFDIDEPAAQAVLDEIANMGGTGSALFADDRTSLIDRLGEALDQAAPGESTRSRPAFASVGANTATQKQFQLNAGFRMPEDESLPWEGILDRVRFECDATSLEPERKDVDETENDRFHEVLDAQTESPMQDAPISFGACPASEPRCLLTVIPDDLRNLEGHLTGRPCFPDSSGDGETCLDPLAPTGAPGGGGRGKPKGPGGAPPSCGGSPGHGGPGHGGPPPDPAGAETDLELQAFSGDNASLDKRVLGVSTDTERDEVIAWIHGLDGTEREGRRLGDIMHSTPVVVGAPQRDLPDESFNLFRQRPEVANRPTVAYVGTNDGILHAFVVDDTEVTGGPYAGAELDAGEELWGFIPPMFLQKLQSATASRQLMLDGTPVVKNVFTRRLPGAVPDADIYRTILIVGMRGGGQGYIALDVTDPFEPRFLWQFAHEDMGFTFGEPGLGQILVEGRDGLQERGFALVPGGTGVDLTDPDSGCGAAEDLDGDGEYDKPLGCPARGKGTPPVNEGTSTARENIPCFDSQGRRLFFVDVATGERVGLFDDETFNAPLTGGVSFFPGDVGTIATRAYLTDHAGVIWRIDMSNPRMSDWFADPFHDIFWDGEAISGQPAYHAPVISTDREGNVVLVQGTGDIDELDGTDSNRVVSLTEQISFEEDGSVADIGAKVNWEVRLEPGEQVTAPLELFNSKIYFTSFQSTTDATNACEFGQSRAWSVHYIDSEEDGSGLPVGGWETETDPEPQRFLPAIDNELLMGVSVAQRPSCVDLADITVTDPYVGTSAYQRVTGQGGGKFVGVVLSGGGDGMGGSQIGERQFDVEQPASFTEVQSFAGSVE